MLKRLLIRLVRKLIRMAENPPYVPKNAPPPYKIIASLLIKHGFKPYSPDMAYIHANDDEGFNKEMYLVLDRELGIARSRILGLEKHVIQLLKPRR